jgi:polyhydroxyalkanoate synthesis regulator phasin
MSDLISKKKLSQWVLEQKKWRSWEDYCDVQEVITAGTFDADDSEVQRLREALETIQKEIKLWNSPEAALNVIKTITDTALSPQKG